jgi:hypothetical protein
MQDRSLGSGKEKNPFLEAASLLIRRRADSLVLRFEKKRSAII